MGYKEEDFLLLSGLQHFKFCRRQWALIHIEHQWADNFRTVDGSLMHENAHDKGFNESRGDRIITRGMNVFSAKMGISGECDVVEFLINPGGITLDGKESLWQPYPVEYKRGAPNAHGSDALQLCAQAMCLEEMLCCKVPEGALYYGETRHREHIIFTDDLRQSVRDNLTEMHDLFRRGYTPKVKPTKACNACSMKELCLPKLMNRRTVRDYIHHSIEVME